MSDEERAPEPEHPDDEPRTRKIDPPTPWPEPPPSSRPGSRPGGPPTGRPAEREDDDDPT